MAFKPNTEPVFPPGFPLIIQRNYKGMSISELVSILRTAYQMDVFDKVEEELVSRDANLKAEIGPLVEKIEVEKQSRVEAEEQLKRKEEQCERGKRAQESYEKLLREVKTNGLVDKNIIGELRNKNLALECENSELKKKWVDDANAVAELRTRIRVLEDEKVDDKNALDALRMKNTELVETVKENSATIEELRTENSELVDEKRRHVALVESLEKKFGELNLRIEKLENDTKLLMIVDDNGSGGRNTEVKPPADPRVICVVKDEEDNCNHKLVNGTGDPVPLQINEELCHSLSPSKGNKDTVGASARERLKWENVIEIIDSDDDEDGCSSQKLHGKKAISQTVAKTELQSTSDAVQHKSIFTKSQVIDMVKRKYSFLDNEISTSTSSSSADSNMDNRLLRPISCKKKSKT